MPAIDLTEDEVLAIETACMVLREHARRGRLYESESDTAGDQAVAEWYAAGVKRVDTSRIALQALRDRWKETANASD